MLFGDAVLGSNVLGSTEALTVTPTPTPTNPLLGGGGSRRKWKKEKWERVRDEDFDSDITPEPIDIEPAAETKIPDPPRPMVARGPALPEPQTFEPPVPWTPTVEDTDALPSGISREWRQCRQRVSGFVLHRNSNRPVSLRSGSDRREPDTMRQ
jgi:hypothetical protein